ncbi:hypothetical protein EYF80_038825 [Liparis tanakae]|uniref:Uncharacterized protein n=1 Tax=Liparis tanakae TaxID=230148 RepID=A0A4Z2GE50_9TELE|nr:hypothetical protein EYF80_038825 [Liparis tanakae]
MPSCTNGKGEGRGRMPTGVGGSPVKPSRGGAVGRDSLITSSESLAARSSSSVLIILRERRQGGKVLIYSDYHTAGK